MDFQRYLASKTSVDDRSLHPRVLDAFKQRWPTEGRVLELGAGIGTMARRLLALKWPSVEYHLLDARADNLSAARALLGSPESWKFAFHREELDTFLATAKPWDAVIAHAFLDLFDLETLVPRLAALGRPGTPFWLTLNFDHWTHWEPELPGDSAVLAAYHGSMNPGGAGSSLFHLLPQHGFDLVDAGASDWAVWPRGGAYAEDESYFLLCLLEFFESSLGSDPKLVDVLPGWLAERRKAVTEGRARFFAHQWDFLAVRR